MALYTHVAALLIGAAMAGVAGWNARGWKSDADAAELRQAAEETRRLRERTVQATVKRIDHETDTRARRNAGLDAADRDELERLRIAAAGRDARDPVATCEPVEEQFRECRAALAEGAGLVVEGARLVREVERANQGLRSYAAELGGVQLDDPPADR